MGFWIKLTIAPARVALGITTFLAVKVSSDSEVPNIPAHILNTIQTFIKTLGQSFSRGMPKVSYVKMIDVWMIGLESFI